MSDVTLNVLIHCQLGKKVAELSSNNIIWSEAILPWTGIQASVGPFSSVVATIILNPVRQLQDWRANDSTVGGERVKVEKALGLIKQRLAVQSYGCEGSCFWPLKRSSSPSISQNVSFEL